MAKSKQRATYEDLERLPEHLIGEIIDGELVATPRPGSSHSRVAIVVSGELYGSFDRFSRGPGGWWLLYEPELHLHGDVLVPDVAGWRSDRVPKLPDAPAIEIAPDWVCEVLSRSTVRHDRGGKMRIYAREKVANVWLVDPANHSLEVLRLDGEQMKLVSIHDGAEKVSAEPFAAIEIDLSRWWID